MQPRIDLLQFTGVDRDFFESYGNRTIDDGDFVEAVRRVVARRRQHGERAPWRIERRGIWVHCMPSAVALPAQGWKIHVSSIAATARIVLSITAAVLVDSGVGFKFAADAKMLDHINGKRWPRGGSGKFITVYPRDTHEFRRVLEDLYASLSGYVGPYVLSDRRYRDSRVLYFRYGGIRGEHRVTADGRREWLLVRPDGGHDIDARQPYYRLPEWLRDPFEPVDDAQAMGPLAIGGGRFRVHDVLAFSAAGGVYLADDLDEGRRVVIKEARPYIGGNDGATMTLRKEFRLLRLLAPLRVAPRPIAHFRDWEHTFLVEEYLEGDTLRRWLARRYPWLKTRATRQDAITYLEDICKVFSDLAATIERVHAVGVSIGDLSFHNCIVAADGRVRIIDMEACVEDGLDIPVDMRTPGFASAMPRRDVHAQACMEDYHAFGANLLAAMMPMNGMLPLDRSAASRFALRMVRDMGYPFEFAEVIHELLAEEASSRPRPTIVMRRLCDAVARLEGGNLPVPHRLGHGVPVCDPVAELFRFVEDQALKARPDRYVPAGPEVFETHPWGVAHGAAGVLHAYRRVGRAPPGGLLDYVLAGIDQPQPRGISLMDGDTGIAWVLFDEGRHDEASVLMRRSSGQSVDWTSHGLHDGLAGWGLGRLKAWYETADGAFLREAIDAGDAVLAAGVRSEDGLRWPASDVQPIGLAYGASGIALFLMHLDLVTGEKRYLDGACAGLDYDFSQRRLNADGDPTWPMHIGHATATPYLRQGTAGVVAVAARMFVVTGNERYRDMVLAAEADLFRSHAIFPGLFDGLAGIGETLLDLAACLPDRRDIYLREATRVAGGIEPFMVRRPEGLVIPGAELVRLSCDFATGNAGIAAFYERLQRGGSASFMLDEHMPSLADVHLPQALRA